MDSYLALETIRANTTDPPRDTLLEVGKTSPACLELEQLPWESLYAAAITKAQANVVAVNSRITGVLAESGMRYPTMLMPQTLAMSEWQRCREPHEQHNLHTIGKLLRQANYFGFLTLGNVDMWDFGLHALVQSLCINGMVSWHLRDAKRADPVPLAAYVSPTDICIGLEQAQGEYATWSWIRASIFRNCRTPWLIGTDIRKSS